MTDTKRAYYPLNDHGNALRLVDTYGGDLRYADGLGWLAWDGRRWRRDSEGRVVEHAKAISRVILADAAGADSDKAADAIARWAIRSGDRGRITGMIELAASDPRVRVGVDELDAAPHLLTVANGTLDLRKGKLRNHRREDLITKASPVEFDPEADRAEWDAFLARVQPDPKVRAYVQRATGYTALGRASDDCFFYVHGPTRSGKGTFMSAVAEALGDYATTLPLDAFARQRNADTRPELVHARGARLASVYETSAWLRLDEALLKTLTGGDEITVRELYRNHIRYRPQFVVWIASNFHARLDFTDDAVWRRVREIPFPHSLTDAEIDRGLRGRLADPARGGPAVLAWLVEGAHQYLKSGLEVPAAVRAAGEAYRAEMNPLAAWIDEDCELGSVDDLSQDSASLRESYARYCALNGVKRVVSENEFVKALRALGCEPGKVGGSRAWRGIRLRKPERWTEPATTRLRVVDASTRRRTASGRRPPSAA